MIHDALPSTPSSRASLSYIFLSAACLASSANHSGTLLARIASSLSNFSLSSRFF